MSALPDVAPWLPWRHAVVRDLAWALASPPLLTTPAPGADWLDMAWNEHAWQPSRAWLAALDNDPAPLAPALSRRNGRLGGYFESLIACWLAWPDNPLYRLRYHGLAVKAGRRTVGEMDFLVEERRTGELQHWEVAVKFYLGIAPGGRHADWVGPGLRDRLDIKVERLLQHQLTLGTRPEGRAALDAAGLGPARPVCLLRGRLFYPPAAEPGPWAPQHAAPGHLRGWWMPLADFRRHGPALAPRWQRLPREHWLAPVSPDATGSAGRIGESLTPDQLVEALERAADNRAAAVVGLAGDREVTRGFITPPDWPRKSDPA